MRLVDAAFRGLLLTASLIIAAIVGEIGLRLLGYQGAPHATIDNAFSVDDPVLDWRYHPNSIRRMGRIVYSFNSSGFRDVDHEVENPRGVRRIVVVGDSVTEGLGVQFEEIFSRVLQDRLGPGVEIISLAQGGLNAPQEIHLLEQVGLRYEPDTVIINFVLNDCDFATSLRKARAYMDNQDSRIRLFFDMPFDPRLKRKLKSSALLYFVKERMENVRARLLGVPKSGYFSRIWGKSANREKVVQAFDRLAKLRDDGDFAVVVVIWPILIDYSRYELAEVHRWIETQALQFGFDVVDLLPSFSELDHRKLKIAVEDSVHPNALGHRKAVEGLLDEL